MHPIVTTGVTRRSERDMRLGGYFVPKGTCITVALDAIHHYPGNWPQDPDAFIPVSLCSASASYSDVNIMHEGSFGVCN